MAKSKPKTGKRKTKRVVKRRASKRKSTKKTRKPVPKKKASKKRPSKAKKKPVTRRKKAPKKKTSRKKSSKKRPAKKRASKKRAAVNKKRKRPVVKTRVAAASTSAVLKRSKVARTERAAKRQRQKSLEVEVPQKSPEIEDATPVRKRLTPRRKASDGVAKATQALKDIGGPAPKKRKKSPRKKPTSPHLQQRAEIDALLLVPEAEQMYAELAERETQDRQERAFEKYAERKTKELEEERNRTPVVFVGSPTGKTVKVPIDSKSGESPKGEALVIETHFHDNDAERKTNAASQDSPPDLHLSESLENLDALQKNLEQQQDPDSDGAASFSSEPTSRPPVTTESLPPYETSESVNEEPTTVSGLASSTNTSRSQSAMGREMVALMEDIAAASRKNQPIVPTPSESGEESEGLSS